MFGQNAVAKAIDDPALLNVHSVFYTIQGEGPWAGLPTIFLRLAGCNLRCVWCDTEFEKGARTVSVGALANELLTLADRHDCRRFVVTGGEPLLQAGVVALLKTLWDYHFQFETAGTVWPAGLDDEIARRKSRGFGELVFVCSPKTPSVHLKVAQHATAWKYVVRAGEPVTEWGVPVTATQPGQAAPRALAKFLPMPGRDDPEVYVQPMDEQDPEKNAANLRFAAELCLKHGHRLSVQMHKLADLP